MSHGDQALLKLALLAGIAPNYVDAWGTPRQVGSDTLRALLAAVGYPAATPAEIADSVTEAEAEPWRGLLPPVVVVTGGDAAATVPLNVPSRLDAGRVLWTIVTEDGARSEHGVGIEALAVLENLDDGHHPRRRLALPLDPALPLGYHRLRVSLGDEDAETPLIIAPAACQLPGVAPHGAAGLSAQLHGLRSTANWGIGDFSDLARLAALAARHGLQTLGVNPLHALYPAVPRHISPYSPSSRLFLNPLYIDVEAVPEWRACAEAQSHAAASEFRAARAAARAAEFIDHTAVAALKQPMFTALHRAFAAEHLVAGDGARTERGAAFRRFQREGGRMLRAYGTFNALQAHCLATGQGQFWANWPGPLRDAASSEVVRFAETHRDAVELHQYLDWEADRQLGAAAATGRRVGLRLGFYRDLAVGIDPQGAEAWADPGRLVTGATIGAPPDVLNLKGQDWGLAPPDPLTMRRQAYAPFIDAVRATMRHAGIVRLDHVMGLQHLFCIPRGARATEGAYVRYPFTDLLRILALESTRHGCAVIGEDLGTVPQGFSDQLNGGGILSYRVMLFERDDRQGFVPPARYRRRAAAVVATHDVATLRGYWLGRDLEWRQQLDLYPTIEARAGEVAARRHERRQLLDALLREGLQSNEEAAGLLDADGAPRFSAALAAAVHRYLGRTASDLALLQLEDAVGELEQANLPGTVDEHPNWRRRLGRTLDELDRDEMFRLQVAALTRGRRERPS
jgi:4-alpha-glucanotransferase